MVGFDRLLLSYFNSFFMSSSFFINFYLAKGILLNFKKQKTKYKDQLHFANGQP